MHSSPRARTRPIACSRALGRITPTRAEQAALDAAIARAQLAVRRAIGSRELEPVLVGSVARGTWMRHKREFDLFVRFPEDTPRERLEREGLALGRRTAKLLGAKATVAYAEHPYTRLSFQGFLVDLVPCYAVRSAAHIKSAVDRTPFHNEWLAEHLPARLAGDVRLLKQFTRGAELYGSDSRTQGFSGYLCELLIIHAGGFEPLLAQARDWEPGTLIDLAGHHADAGAPRKRFREQPLIVIDPVDPERNVAAALSPANFVRFVARCRAFLRTPSMEHFFPKPARPSARRLRALMAQRGTQFLAVSFRRPAVIDDTLWPQLRRTAARLADILREYEFVPINADAFADERRALLLAELEVWQLPALRKVGGPVVGARQHVEAFLRKYRPQGRCYVEGRRWVAEVRRRWPRADRKLADTLSDRAAELRAKGIGSFVAESIAKQHTVLDSERLLALARKEPGVAAFLQQFLERDY